MRLSPRIWTALACAVPLTAAAAPASAQDEPPPVTRIVLHPAAEPVPALKYRLVPGRAELVPGNAAIYYHRAIEIMLEAQAQHAADPDPARRTRYLDMEKNEWSQSPLKDIPLEQARDYLQGYHRVFPELELAVHRFDCDWEFDARPEAFDLLIHEIQLMRSLVRLVALKARVAVLEGRPDEAIRWLQVGLTMSRHVGRGPLMIQALVAVHSTMVLATPLEDLLQLAGTPNLYWALADMPRPWIEPTAIDAERMMVEREVPRLRELDGLPWSVEKGRSFADEIISKMMPLIGSGRSPSPGAGRDWSSTGALTALVAQAYPASKRTLIARGRPKDQVNAMPAVQVVFLDAYLDYQVYRDDVYKWAGLPFPQAYAGMLKAEGRLREIHDRMILRLFCSLITNVQSFLMATGRADRRLGAIQCIEAIGLYAATHHKLPAKLEDIQEVPIPIDPLTGRPFEYRLEGNRAFLSAPVAPAGFQHPSFGLRYSIELAP